MPLRISAEVELLSLINDYIKEAVPAQLQPLLPLAQLVAEELVVNVASYAYTEHVGELEIDCGMVSFDGQNMLYLTVRDWGPAYNPFYEAKTPDLTLGMDERPIGGLGIHMVKQMSAHHWYIRDKDSNLVGVYIEPAA